ncbi:hypothetical protein, partial [Leptolyngbya sp. FACHB-711]|uniref:hypothetical protein n=1 Tax=Leptolyngbya sp. FACHB-711 TaxID=2692813 RepID=UPI001A7E5C35
LITIIFLQPIVYETNRELSGKGNFRTASHHSGHNSHWTQFLKSGDYIKQEEQREQNCGDSQRVEAISSRKNRENKTVADRTAIDTGFNAISDIRSFRKMCQGNIRESSNDA